jgi:glycosyltransferase involved in cell wall biosynthesis
VLSVAALNRYHKRIDYLIEEIAELAKPRPFLLLLGEQESETSELRLLARGRLGDTGFEIRTVGASQVADFYRASDVFVLTSLVEAQGRALIEAASHGLPCIAHDSSVIRFAVGEHAFLGDLRTRGSLAELLRRQFAEDPETLRLKSIAAHRHVYERFSWERLKPRYVALLAEVARLDVKPDAAKRAISA